MSGIDDRHLGREERRLAALLDRPGRGAPTAAMDAAILAAARAPLRRPRRPSPRFIGGLAAAASLCLAIGIAWQLRPALDHVPPPVADDAAATDATTVPAPARAVASLPPPLPPMEPPAPPKAASPARPPAPAARTATDRTEPATPARGTAQAHDAPVAEVVPPPPPTPPAPPAPALPQAVPAPAAAPAKAAATWERAPAQRIAAPPAATAASQPATPPTPAPPPTSAPAPAAARQAMPAATGTVLEDIIVTGTRTRRAEAADEDVPPVTADDPMVRDAWLRNILDLQAAGATQAARNSLRQFRLRYPHHPLPESLRELGEEPAPR